MSGNDLSTCDIRFLQRLACPRAETVKGQYDTAVTERSRRKVLCLGNSCPRLRSPPSLLELRPYTVVSIAPIK